MTPNSKRAARLLGAILFVATSSAGSASEPATLDVCLEMSGGERRGCFELWLGARPVDPERLARLRTLAPTDPGTTLELLELLEASEKGRLDSDPALAAAVLELRGEAAWIAERPEESADAWAAAVALDDGIHRLTWSSPSGAPKWTVPLRAEVDRQEKAARSLVAAGRREEARRLLSGALALGARGAARESWAGTGGGTVDGLDPEPTPLSSPVWFPELPRLDVRLHEGGNFRLPAPEAKALLISFWASWCAPCVKELPRLQQLHDRAKDRGLEVLTVNMQESSETARKFARAIELELPIGRYDPELDRAFGVRSLPTVILADRNGRIRRRWDGYTRDVEDEIHRQTGELLQDPTDGPRVELGEVIRGGSLLTVDWSRRIPGSIEGLVVVPADEPTPGIRAVAGRYLVRFAPRGEVAERLKGSSAAGELRRGDLDGDGTAELYSFRRGSTRLVRLDLSGEPHVVWEAPSPVLDLELVEAADETRPGALMLATVDGFYRATPDGSSWERQSDSELRDLALVRQEGKNALAAIDSVGALRWLDPPSETRPAAGTPPRSRRLVAAGDLAEGVGLASEALIASAAGRFLPGDGAQLALATLGQLVIVDLVSGRQLYRVLLDEIGGLAAGDLDGDGLDELAVASGSRMTLLRAAAVSEADTGM